MKHLLASKPRLAQAVADAGLTVFYLLILIATLLMMLHGREAATTFVYNAF